MAERSIGEFLKDTFEGNTYKQWKEQNPTIVPEPTWVTEGVPVGVSNALKGFSQLAGLTVDAISQNIESIPDTYTLKTIEEIWPDISTESTGAEVVGLFTQYGIPLSIASKYAAPLLKLKRVKMADFASKATISGATGNLLKNSGFYGGIGFGVDFATSVAGGNKRFFSDEESPSIDVTNPTDVFMEKIKFGAEGALIGAVPSLLPGVGAGVKYGLFEGMEVVGKVAGPVIRNLDSVVNNTLVKALTADGKYSIPQAFRKIEESIKAPFKNLPDAQTISTFSPFSNKETKFMGLSEGFLKKTDDFLSLFRSRGKLSPNAYKLVTDAEAAASIDMRNAQTLLGRINDKLIDVGDKFKKNFFDQGTSQKVMDTQKEYIFDFLKGNSPLKLVDKTLRPEAVKIKKLLKNINKEYAKALDPKLTNEFGKLVIQDANTYLKQTFSSFYDKFYKVSKEDRKSAVEGLRGYITGKGNAALKDLVIDRLPENFKANPFKAIKTPEFDRELNNMAEEMVDSIISMTRESTYVSGKYTPDQIIKHVGKNILKMDKKVVNPGELFPDYIRKIMGEVKDIDNAVLNTVVQNSRLVYQKKLYDELAKSGLKEGWLFRSIDDAKNLVAKGGLGNVVSAARLRPIARGKEDLFLSDMFEPGKMGTSKYVTTPEIANALEKIDESARAWMNLPMYRSLMTLKSGVQFGKTVLSPMTQIRNVTSASMFALGNGIIGGRTNLIDAFRFIADDIAGKEGVITGRRFQEVLESKLRRGVIDQNVITSELKKVFSGSQQGAFKSVDSLMDFLTKNKFMKKATDFYAGGDNVWKFYADEFYQQALKPAIKNLDDVKTWHKEIAGIKWDPNDVFKGSSKTLDDGIADISAYLVTNTMPTYSKVPEIIKVIRSLPVGNFIAFPAEMFRTSMNMATIGSKEMMSANPYIRQMGARRLLGLATTTYGAGKTVEAAAQYATKVYDDKIEAYRRSFAPVYEKNSQLIPISSMDGEGNFKYINYSYFNPYDVISRPVRAIFNGVASGKINQQDVLSTAFNAFFWDDKTGTPGAVTEILLPFVDEAIGIEAALDITTRGGIKRNGGRVFEESDSSVEKINKSLNHMLSIIEPGAVRSARRIYDGATGRFTDYGSMYDGATEITALLTGQRIETSKPMNSIPFIISSYQKDMRSIQDGFNRPAYSARNSLLDKINAYANANAKAFDSQKRIYQVLKDADALGIESDMIQSLRQRLTKSDAKKITNGQFKPVTFSKERIRGALNRAEDEAYKVTGKSTKRLSALEDTYSEFRSLQLGLKNWDLDDSLDTFKEELKTYIGPIFKQEDPIFYQPKKEPQDIVIPKNQQSSVPSLGNITVAGTAPVSQQVVSVVNPLAGMIQGTGLTASENALLSNEEKSIRMRQKGIIS
tara:strand:+ start:742 stop:4926 length:4185 start_codon:yes stop_codon:yes gene_type:complete